MSDDPPERFAYEKMHFSRYVFGGRWDFTVKRDAPDGEWHLVKQQFHALETT